MYMVFSDKVRKLEDEIDPWIIGRKRAVENFAPIFKDDTPNEVFKKYKEYVALLKKECAEAM